MRSECIPAEMHPSWVSLKQAGLIQLPWKNQRWAFTPSLKNKWTHCVKAMLHFLEGMPTMFNECITLVNGKLQKSNATLQPFWNYCCFQWILHRLRELSYWSYAVPFQTTFLQKGTFNLTKVAFVMFLFKQRRLTFVHFKYAQLLSKH